jgi:hypothetical protein
MLFAMNERKHLKVETNSPGNYNRYLEHMRPFISEETFHPLLLDEDIYTDIIRQPSALTFEDTPLLLGLDDSEKLVNVERTAVIAASLGDFNRNDIFLATVPLGMLMRWMPVLMEQGSGGNSKRLIFSEIEVSENETYTKFKGAARSQGIAVHSLEHPRLHTEAALNLFELNVSSHTSPQRETKSLVDIADEGRVPLGQNREAGDLVITRGHYLTDNDLTKLWELFSKRFTDISDNLPFRLEENEEATRALMSDPRYTFIYSRGAQGEIEACVFIADDPGAFPWINDSYLKARDEALCKEGKAPYSVFIPGIAAVRSGRGSVAAGQVLARFTDVLAATNHPEISVRFECTDVSSRYVPLVSMRAARDQPAFTASSVQQVGQKKYIALQVPAP